MERHAVVMIGATGAVGGHVAQGLCAMPQVERLTLLGRRHVEGLGAPKVRQHVVDLFDPASYRELLAGHTDAICTLGVGEPSKVSRQQFVAVDKEAPRDFASESRRQGVQHFQLLSSVGVEANSRSFYLRTKGELEDELRALRFARLSLFHPSMILTPTNRYGLMQAITLLLWPWLTPLLQGKLRAYRGVQVETLGLAMAANVLCGGDEPNVLEWDEFQVLADRFREMKGDAAQSAAATGAPRVDDNA